MCLYLCEIFFHNSKKLIIFSVSEFILLLCDIPLVPFIFCHFSWSKIWIFSSALYFHNLEILDLNVEYLNSSSFEVRPFFEIFHLWFSFIQGISEFSWKKICFIIYLHVHFESLTQMESPSINSHFSCHIPLFQLCNLL